MKMLFLHMMMDAALHLYLLFSNLSTKTKKTCFYYQY